jgi:hypothetical protein
LGEKGCRAYSGIKIQGRTYQGDGQTWLLENRYSAQATEYFAGEGCAANRIRDIRWQDRNTGNWMEYTRSDPGSFRLPLTRFSVCANGLQMA